MERTVRKNRRSGRSPREKKEDKRKKKERSLESLPVQTVFHRAVDMTSTKLRPPRGRKKTHDLHR